VKRTRMRPVSRKRAAQNRVYATLRVEFLTANPYCQNPLGCGLPAVDVHHRMGRVGALLLDVDHWSALCRKCHEWVGAYPEVAYSLGISERRVGGAA
jgi:hypothetical protein